MAQTEGEKELVLGNKQLISLFFVVVALCGVFFAMGYMMGRPSGKQLAAIPETGPAAQVAPVQAQESAPPHETPPPDTQSPASAETASATPPPATQTQAARDVPATATATAVPEAGATYLQVTALRRTDADNLVKTLKEQNFPALLADSSKPDLFRVLVGPYQQTADVADAKARLKALGFANAFVQK
jgi:cell division septation protein DedD